MFVTYTGLFFSILKNRAVCSDKIKGGETLAEETNKKAQVNQPFYSQTDSEVLKAMDTTVDGLSSEEAKNVFHNISKRIG